VEKEHRIAEDSMNRRKIKDMVAGKPSCLPNPVLNVPFPFIHWLRRIAEIVRASILFLQLAVIQNIASCSGWTCRILWSSIMPAKTLSPPISSQQLEVDPQCITASWKPG
jgi:hypothetical protein